MPAGFPTGLLTRPTSPLARRAPLRHVGSVGGKNRLSRRHTERGIVFGAGASCPLPVRVPGATHRRLPAGVPHRRQEGHPEAGYRPTGRHPCHADRAYTRRHGAESAGLEPGSADHQRPGQWSWRVGLRGRRGRRQPGHHGARKRRQRGPQPRPDRPALHPPGAQLDAGAARSGRAQAPRGNTAALGCPGAAALRRAGCAALGRAGCAALGRSGAAAALSAGAATVACSRPQSCPERQPRSAERWRGAARRPATR